MSQVLEFASSVVKNLPEVPEEVRKWWIENPLDLQAALGVLSQKPSPKLEVFKTIKLGTGLKNAHDFRNDFKGNSLNVSDWAYSMMENPAFVVAAEATLPPDAKFMAFVRFWTPLRAYGIRVQQPRVTPFGWMLFTPSLATPVAFQ